MTAHKMTPHTRDHESEEQGGGGFTERASWPPASGPYCIHVDCHDAPVPGQNACAAHLQVALLPQDDSGFAVQAFQAGGELARVSHGIADIKTIVSRHEARLMEVDVALGKFRDNVIKPVHEELKFLRYNLGDKANVTVSQMQGILGHFDKLFVGLLVASGKDDRQIRAIRESLGIPANLPTLEQLEAEGRPQVDQAAMQASLETLAAQNARLIAANEAQTKRHEQQVATLISRIEKLEGGHADQPVSP